MTKRPPVRITLAELVLFEIIILPHNTSVKTQKYYNLTLKTLEKKVYLKMVSVRLLIQFQSGLDLHCLSKRLQNISAGDKTRQLFFIVLRVNESDIQIYTVTIFMKCTHICMAQTTYSLFTKPLILPDLPSSADE